MNPNAKRMLSIQSPDPYYSPDKTTKKVFINASSVTVIQECLRKAHYLLERNLSASSDESEAQTFGSAIHAGLAVFYSHRPSDRVLADVINAFDAYGDRLSGSQGTKRSVENGRKILEGYFSTYKDDPWVTYQDSSGPFVERQFELPFGRVGGYDITVFGTIDAVLRNIETGEIAVVDHKTTSSLGDQFYKQLKPRLQFAMYSWAVRSMGIPAKSFMMNGIQVAKTKQEYVRLFADYGPDDDEELRIAVSDAVTRYLWATGNKIYPMTTGACASYGGCQYHEICSARANQREFVIQSKYGVQNG